MMKKSEKYNSAGYLDLTAYHAINKIEREQTRRIAEQKRKEKQKRKDCCI